MQAHAVPKWAIESCQKIQYMFPRSHAAAYVIMALRVAWYKVHEPLSYYAAYFSVRANGFDAATMLVPMQTVRERVKAILEREDRMNPTEEREKNALHMILEMNLRGFTLLPVHLYKSDKKNFLIEGSGLRCPFLSINGFPEAIADSIIAERAALPAAPLPGDNSASAALPHDTPAASDPLSGEDAASDELPYGAAAQPAPAGDLPPAFRRFLSVEDLRSRTRAGEAVIEMLKKQGALEDLAESSQIDLFSMLGGQ